MDYEKEKLSEYFFLLHNLYFILYVVVKSLLNLMLLILREFKKYGVKFSTFQRLAYEPKRRYSFEVNTDQSVKRHDDIYFKF